MAAVLQPATTGRAKCRGCGAPIAKGELRLGDTFANPFAEGAETTHWYHPLCAAYKRPEPTLAALEAAEPFEQRDLLTREARRGIELRRLPRIDGAEKAPSARAACRSCRQPIDRGTWRIRLTYFEDGRFTPGGFVHLGCRNAYFEFDDVLGRVLHFSPGLGEVEREDLTRACAAGPAPPAEPSGG